MEIIQADKDRDLSESTKPRWTIPGADVPGGNGDASGILIPVSFWGSSGAKEGDLRGCGETMMSFGCSGFPGQGHGDSIGSFLDLVEFGRHW